MNIATFSPALVLLFVCALLWILMNVRFHSLTPLQKWLVPVLLVLLAAFNHLLREYLGSAAYSRLILLVLHLPVFLIFLRITKCGLIKMVFMIFTAVVFMAPTIIVGNLVKRLFHNSSLGLLLANLITYIAVLLLAQFVFRPGFNYLLRHADGRFALRFLPVPLLYYVYLFAAMNADFSSLTMAGGYIIRMLPSVFVFVFYFLLLRNFKDLDEKRRLETEQTALTHQLDATREQIELLNQTQTQTAIYQHNMRHHLNVIEGFLSTGKPDQAQEYIKGVYNDVEAITPKQFCENGLVNLLCSSFMAKAERLAIRLSVGVTLPKTLSVSDTELCAVLSNGLENAFHAAASLEESRRWVELSARVRLNKLLIEIQNPYEGEVLMQDGLPVSEQEGHGYGCRSIHSITQRCRGICTFEPKNGLFTLRVAIPLENRSAQPPAAE